MALIRGQHHSDGRFTQVPNEWIRDSRLGLDSRGLIIQLFSHQPGWRVTIESLAKANNVGKDKIRRMIGELMEYGYLTRSENQGHNEQGYLTGYDYITSDPSPLSGYPTKVQPTKVQPTKDNPTLKNTNKKNTIKKNTNNNISRASQLPKKWEPSEAMRETFAEKYPGLVLADEAEAFRDYHTSKGSLYKDWDACFRTWCRNALKWAKPSQHRKLTNAEQAHLLVLQMQNGQVKGEIGG